MFTVAVFALTARTGSAQYNTAEIEGVVTDSQGGVLPGAAVVAVHVASRFRLERISDDKGRFFLPALPPGEFVLTVALPGFKQATQRGLVLAVGQKIPSTIRRCDTVKTTTGAMRSTRGCVRTVSTRIGSSRLVDPCSTCASVPSAIRHSAGIRSSQ